MRWLLTIPLKIYRLCISPLFPAHCIYTPSCSHYAEQAIARFGLLRGSLLALLRLSRCIGGWFVGGDDPLPEDGSIRGALRHYRRRRRNCRA